MDQLKSEVPESAVVLVTCLTGQPGRLEFRSQPVKALEILKFNANGHVFAYRVTAQLMGAASLEGRAPLGSEVIVTFYDNDGSGRFTIMQYPGPGLIPALDVPDWVGKHSKE